MDDFERLKDRLRGLPNFHVLAIEKDTSRADKEQRLQWYAIGLLALAVLAEAVFISWMV